MNDVWMLGIAAAFAASSRLLIVFCDRLAGGIIVIGLLNADKHLAALPVKQLT